MKSSRFIVIKSSNHMRLRSLQVFAFLSSLVTVFAAQALDCRLVQRLKSKMNEHATDLMKRLPKKSLDCRRGRPVHQRPSLHEFTTCWYLIWISKKYGLETRKFLTRFLDAWIHGKSSCKNLSIQCREKTQTDGIFLVTQDQDVVAQVRMSEMALNRMSDVDLTSFPWNELTD